MKLKVSPDYAAAPSEVSFVPNDRGALISGGQQHVALAISGPHLVPSCALEVVQEPEAWHPTIQAQFLLGV